MINPHGGAPVYAQVAAELRTEIEGGEPGPGQPLPAEADLAARFGVGKDTVRAAFRLLGDEGLIITRRGYRAVVRPQPPRTIVQAEPDVPIFSRRANPADRDELHLQPGDWVTVVGDDVYPAETVEVRYRR